MDVYGKLYLIFLILLSSSMISICIWGRFSGFYNRLDIYRYLMSQKVLYKQLKVSPGPTQQIDLNSTVVCAKT